MTTPDDVTKAAQYLRSHYTDRGWQAALEGRVKDGGTARCTAVLAEWALSQPEVTDTQIMEADERTPWNYTYTQYEADYRLVGPLYKDEGSFRTRTLTVMRDDRNRNAETDEEATESIQELIARPWVNAAVVVTRVTKVTKTIQYDDVTDLVTPKDFVPSPTACSHAGHKTRFRTGANDGCDTCGVSW